MSQAPTGETPGTDRTTRLPDPRTAYANGRFPGQQQDYPGWTEAMDPVPDHGEDSYPGKHRPDGMNALITGEDAGIGRAVAIAYAREGADVAFTNLPEEDSDAAQTVDTPGKLDILVNNAGFQMTVESLEDLKIGQLERTFETNVYSLLWPAMAAPDSTYVSGTVIGVTGGRYLA